MPPLLMVAYGQFLGPTKVVPFSYLLKILCNIYVFHMFFKPEGLVRRFIRDDNGVHFDKPSPSYDQKDFVPVEVKAGSLVLIHGDLIHQRSLFINF